jgi:tetratricopeptide (TPR) repeat protein
MLFPLKANRPIPRFLVFVNAILVACSSLQSLAQEADKIYPRNGAPQTGQILEVTKDNVVMEVRGNKQNFATQDIARLIYEGEPAQFSRAKEQVASGQWDQAIESLKRVDPKSIERAEAKQDLLFYLGFVQAQMALKGTGDAEAAKKRLRTYAQGNPQSHHFYDLSETLGLLSLSGGQYEDAVKFFTAMGQAKFSETKLKSRYYVGSALLSQGKATEARTAFNEAVSATAETAEAKKYQKMAKVSIHRCDVGEGKVAEGVDNLWKMIEESDATDSQLFANIYNALGEAHSKSGKNDEAILAFLHTDLLFSVESDAHAEALYQLSKLFAVVGEAQKAADAKARLQSLYANSPWAKK